MEWVELDRFVSQNVWQNRLIIDICNINKQVIVNCVNPMYGNSMYLKYS